jgi:hypothetical protein
MTLALMAMLSVAPATSRACMFDDEDNGFSLDTLDHYYPGGYSVVLKMVEARRDGRLMRLLDPAAPKLFMLQRLLKVVRGFEAQVRAAALEHAAEGQPPAFSLLLVESMLWVRFPATVAERAIEVHLPEPKPGDLIAIMGEDALIEIAAGRMTLAEAEKDGWLQFHGSGPAIARFYQTYSRIGDGIRPAPAR